MVSPDERQQLMGIARWFEAENPRLAKALRDGTPRRRLSGVVMCGLVDLVAAGSLVVAVVLSNAALMMASVALIGLGAVSTSCGRLPIDGDRRDHEDPSPVPRCRARRSSTAADRAQENHRYVLGNDDLLGRQPEVLRLNWG